MYEFIKIIDSKEELKLIKPKHLINLKLYHVSESKKITRLNPRVPKNERTEIGVENSTTKRICLAPSIEQCLQAINVEKGKEYCVYVPKKNLMYYNIYKCSDKEVPDSNITDEYWCLGPMEVEPLYLIKIGAEIETNSNKYSNAINYKIIKTFDITPSNILEDLAKLKEVKYVKADQNDLNVWLEFKDYKEARKFATICKRELNEALVVWKDKIVYYKTNI